MRAPISDLQQYLDDLARTARPGDRVPAFRDLMRRFGASQLLVQRAFDQLKARGLIASQVGRGTYFVTGAAPASDTHESESPSRGRSPASAVRSVLLLRRSISIVRGRVLVEGLQRCFTAEGHRVLEVSYSDPDHARTVLKSLPRFDACVIQSTFKTIPIDTLAALREKCEVLAVDGAALVGTDVEAVGMEWGEPLAAAVAMLRRHGHQRIAFACTAQSFLAVDLGRRRFDALRAAPEGAGLQAITLPQLPDEAYEDRLVDALLATRDTQGQLPFSALVAWGIEDGARLRGLLADAGLVLPSQLSVVLLGRTDLANEHAGFFHTIGCRVADQVQGLHQAITARWADPSRPYGIRFVPVVERAGESVAGPRASGEATMAAGGGGEPTVGTPGAQRRRVARATVSSVMATDSPT